jgi:hypothetical protein
VAVEIDAVTSAVKGMQRAGVVMDLRQVAAAELLAAMVDNCFHGNCFHENKN